MHCAWGPLHGSTLQWTVWVYHHLRGPDTLEIRPNINNLLGQGAWWTRPLGRRYSCSGLGSQSDRVHFYNTKEHWYLKGQARALSVGIPSKRIQQRLLQITKDSASHVISASSVDITEEQANWRCCSAGLKHLLKCQTIPLKYSCLISCNMQQTIITYRIINTLLI